MPIILFILIFALTACSGRHGSSAQLDETYTQAPDSLPLMKVKFYLERSGSMVPYDSPECKGEFKAAIVGMLNNLPGDNEDSRIFIVNDAVYDYPENLRGFINDGHIFETTRNVGNPQFTDFSCILDSVLNRNGKNELSILVSDMIYSIKDLETINPQKIFNESEGMTHNVFRSKVNEKSIILVKMNSSFAGQYYPYNTPLQGVSYNGNRPYYFIIVGDNECIARISQSEKYRNFIKFDNLMGFEHKYLFATSDVYHPYYSLMMGDDDRIKGRFRNVRDNSENITSLEDIEADRNTDELQLVMAVNLDGMMIEQDILTNRANYEILSEDEVELKEITLIQPSEIVPTSRSILQRATHKFVLRIPKLTHNQSVTLRLKNSFPQWIADSSSDDDTDMQSTWFERTTFGLKYMMKGIYDCYRKQTDGEPYYFSMTINLKK